MINIASLDVAVRSAGFYSRRNDRFELFRYLTGSTSALLCAERSSVQEDVITPFGISFWIHIEDGLAFVGFWSGIFYQVPNISALTDITIKTLQARYHHSGIAPWNYPAGVAEEFGLIQCNLVDICSMTDAEYYDAAKDVVPPLQWSESQFANAVSTRVDALSIAQDGFITMKKGTAVAVTRFAGNHTARRFLSLLLHDYRNNAGDQIRLLRALKKSLSCSLFEGCSWGGNQIHLDDPYYALAGCRCRPEEPRNAWLSDKCRY